MGRQASTVATRIKIRANIYFDETAMTIANVDDFMSGLALVMTAFACRSVSDASEKTAPVGRTT